MLGIRGQPLSRKPEYLSADYADFAD